MLTEKPTLDLLNGEAHPATGCTPPCLGDPCRQRIYRLAQRLLKDPEDVEDLVQEVCMRCLLGQKRLRSDVHFRTWLYRAIGGACKAAQRQHLATVLSAECRSSREALGAAFQAAHTAPASEEAAGIVESVRVALQRLAPRERRLLEWRYLEGDSFVEIAQRLGIAERSARPALQRARNAFRHAYKEVWSREV